MTQLLKIIKIVIAVLAVIFVIIIFLLLTGCEDPAKWDTYSRDYITFSMVASPCIDEYGEPECIDKFNDEDYYYVSYFYYTYKLVILFSNIPGDSVNGWKVDHIEHF